MTTLHPAPRAPTPRPLAWVDGRVVPADQATVPLLDDGFLRGDAVFDAMLVREGRTHARDRHLARLRASARTLGLRVPVLTRAIEDLLAAWGTADGALKIVVTRGGAVRGLLQPVSWPTTLSLAAVHAPWLTPLSGAKTLSYATNQWAARQARAAHADDALVVDPQGNVLELPTAAIVLVLGDRLVTPDPSLLPVLPSVSVEVLREVAEVTPGTPTLADAHAADELLVLSATRPLLSVHALDDTDYPAPGGRGEALQEVLAQHIDATLD